MPDPVAAHYTNLLARYYSWMFGLSFEEKVTEQRAILEPLLKDTPRGLAIDLGCGPGFQTMALSQLGFRQIHALDTSAELLTELAAHTDRLPIHTHHADILSLDETNIVPSEMADVIVCMGDTLTHLPTLQSVRHLFRAVAATLVPGGLFILTWRDLTPQLTGSDRFIPVRADDQRIMTCFLEYTSPTTVQVYDLVYTRNPTGWTLEKSSYPKLRLSPAQVAQELAAAGLESRPSGTAGRLSLVAAQKPAANHEAATGRSTP
jgi:SAM-dependent methyltransferase